MDGKITGAENSLITTRPTGAGFLQPDRGQWRRRKLRTTLAALKGLGCVITLQETTHRGHAEETAARLTVADTDVVVAAGGDGTINEVANGLVRSPGPRPPLAVIPLGTANVLAAEIGLFGNPRAVCPSHRARRLDDRPSG